MITTRDIEWSVGFLEGEGHFHHGLGPRGGSEIGAGQVQRHPLDRLQRLFGGSIRLRKAQGKWQPCYIWTLCGPAARGVAMTLYSLMSPRRRGQIARMLLRWRGTRPRAEHRTHCPSGHPYAGDNLVVYPGKKGSTQRVCRTCRRAANAKSKARPRVNCR